MNLANTTWSQTKENKNKPMIEQDKTQIQEEPSREKISQEIISLVEKAQQGNQVAFSELMQRYREKLYRVLFFLVHHQEDALDLLQETFLKAYKSLDSLRTPGAFYSWIVRIAVNLAINSMKKNDRIKKYQEKMIREYSHRSENPLEILQKKELKEQIMELIAMLPDKQRVAIVLCDIEGYSYKEIADILKCRIGTVMSRIHYGRDYIRAHLPDYQVKSTKTCSQILG